jgi:hypothetical protein
MISAPAWSLGKRIAFRFLASYIFLYSLPFPVDALIAERSAVPTWYSELWDPAVNLLGGALGVDQELSTVDNGSGDRLGNYILLLVFLIVAALATLAWSILDRRRRDYTHFHDFLRVWVRYMLAATMLSYGFAKVWPLQFQTPGYARLLQPYGESSPMGLLWTFMGASPEYRIFAGLGEVIGGVLLLWRRTATLGAIVVAAVMLNVFMLNMAYDVCVKLFSAHLVLAAVFLLAPAARRLVDVLVLHRAVPAASIDPPPAARWRMRVNLATKVLFVVIMAYSQLAPVLKAHRELRASSLPSEVGGIFDVEELRRAGEVAPPLLTDADYWVRVAITPRGVMALTPDGNRLFFRFAPKDPATKTWGLLAPKDTTPGLTLTSDPDGRHRIDGTWKAAAWSVRLRPSDPKRTTLRDWGFHWVHESPPNR